MPNNNDMLVTLIKEVVKNEVKRQVKEEVAKLIKSGAITLNKEKKSKTSLMDLTEEKVVSPKVNKQINHIDKKIFTKNSVINEILNTTTPFTSAHRAEGSAGMAGLMGGSVLDNIQRESEEDWGTIKMNTDSVNLQTSINMNQTNQSTDAITKALTRDYSELVKRFK